MVLIKVVTLCLITPSLSLISHCCSIFVLNVWLAFSEGCTSMFFSVPNIGVGGCFDFVSVRSVCSVLFARSVLFNCLCQRHCVVFSKEHYCSLHSYSYILRYYSELNCTELLLACPFMITCRWYTCVSTMQYYSHGPVQ